MKSAQVADDQLAQSQEQSEAEDRKLTSRVSMWQTTSRQGRFLVIANRNLDPAIVYAKIAARQRGLDGRRSPAGLVLLGAVPPCAQVELVSGLVDEYVNARFRLGFWDYDSIVVVEPSGTPWQRLPAGAIKTLSKKDQVDLSKAQQYAEKHFLSTPVKDSPVKPADVKECGSTN